MVAHPRIQTDVIINHSIHARRFMCCGCGKPKPMAGSTTSFTLGQRRRVCGDCKAPKAKRDLSK